MQVSNPPIVQQFKILEILRRASDTNEMPAQLISTFLYVASHEGCNQEDLMKVTGMSSSSVSRCVLWLTGQHRLDHRDGLKWIRRVRDEVDWRCYRLFLTAEGKGVVEQIHEELAA